MSSPVTFDGRVAVVTGAGSGLGRSHARLLASLGARVVVNDIHNAALVVDEIVRSGGQAVCDDHDISSEPGALALVEHTAKAYGALDVLVNNAGISTDHPFPDIPSDVFDRVQKINAYGPFFVTKHAWPHLGRSGSGRVVMVASKAALSGGPPNRTHYAASKGAVLAMTRRLAYDGQPLGICVNAVLPTALTAMLVKGADGRAVPNPLVARMADRFGLELTETAELEKRSTAAASAVVAWLCHHDCRATGEFFNAVGGEVSRLSFAIGGGINDPTLTVETVRDRFAAICDMDGASILPAL